MVFQAKTLGKRPAELPEPNLAHLVAMTDDTGILQHAAFNVPRYEDGYCVDDNARALLVTALLEDAGTEDAGTVRALASRYLAFVRHAFNPDQGRFRNFMSYSRDWLEEYGSEDSHGRAVWALGTVVGRCSDPGRQSLSGHLFHAALPALTNLGSPRAWAFALLGIDEYLRAFQGESDVQSVRKALGGSAPRPVPADQRARVALVRGSAHVLQRAPLPGVDRVRSADGERRNDARWMRSLDWLARIQRSTDGCFAPVGSQGFYVRGGTKASFDQQPVEASADDFGLPRGPATDRRRPLGRARVARLQLVSRAERAAAIPLRRRGRAAAATDFTRIG